MQKYNKSFDFVLKNHVYFEYCRSVASLIIAKRGILTWWFGMPLLYLCIGGKMLLGFVNVSAPPVLFVQQTGMLLKTNGLQKWRVKLSDCFLTCACCRLDGERSHLGATVLGCRCHSVQFGKFGDKKLERQEGKNGFVGICHRFVKIFPSTARTPTPKSCVSCF